MQLDNPQASPSGNLKSPLAVVASTIDKPHAGSPTSQQNATKSPGVIALTSPKVFVQLNNEKNCFVK